MGLLDLSRDFFNEHGIHVMSASFPQVFPRMAFGLVGFGSECFGFDDDISRDHDLDLGFYIWLMPEDYVTIGEVVQKAYAALPATYRGVRRGVRALDPERRYGAWDVNRFYYTTLGGNNPPDTAAEWLALPEKHLATATNGAVFMDAAGTFTNIRNRLRAYYPQDVWLRRIAECAFELGQLGQYNYQRSMIREHHVTAAIAVSRFVEVTLSMAHLLERQFCPYYKWMYESFRRLRAFQQIGDQVRRLALESRSTEPRDNRYRNIVNREDKSLLQMENICEFFSNSFRLAGLSSIDGSIMLQHAREIARKVGDKSVFTWPIGS